MRRLIRSAQVNALPEFTTATVNYRIDFLSSTSETFDRIESILAPVVESLNLTFSVKGSHADVSNRVVRLNIVNESDLEPAPLTPASGSAFELMGSTVRHVFDGAIIAPSGMIGACLSRWSPLLQLRKTIR